MRLKHRKTSRGLLQRGSALIAVIAAIAIFSVLAAALLSMTSSSVRQTARTHLSDRAYYMAESGYRYATGLYRHPPAAYPDPNDALENMGERVTLEGVDGRFDLQLFSYFYEITAPAPAGATMLTARTPGSFPSDEIEITSLAGQKVFVQGNTYTLTGGSGLIGEDQLNLAITPALHETVDAKTPVYSLTDAGTGSPWDITNRTIGFVSGQADMFPVRNGRIRVAGRTLDYRLKDETNNVFTDIQDIHGNDLSGYSIPSGAAILLLPYIRVDATGIIGGDNILAQRKVSYYGALPAAFSEVYVESFNDSDSILTTPRGTDLIGTIGSDSNPVLQITAGDAEGLFLSQLDVGEGGDDTANQAREGFNDFRSSSGGYLSYDAQTKVGFFDSLVYHPNFIEHNDLAAGLSFRIKSEGDNANMYGLSFLHREPSTNIPADIIPDSIPPDEPAIVLWQQTVGVDDAVTRTWLAYKNLKTLFYDDFASGIDSDTWTNAGDSWQWSDQALFIEAFGDYAGRVSFSVSLPECGCSEYVLTFNSTVDDIAYRRQVLVYREGDTEPYLPPYNIPPDQGEFPRSLVLPADLGPEITIEFYFWNRLDYGAWKVDDVRIVDESAMPIHSSTLLVRLKEAAAIPFNYTGAATMQTGDRVVGVTSGTRGRVIAPPIVAAAASPQGWVLFNSLSDTWFDVADEFLNVEGKGNIATVHGTPDEGNYRKANIIKVYYASESGCTASVPDPSTPLDCYTLPYERREGYDETLQWPVQDGVQWTAERDYFRLIQWDAVNETDGTDANVGLIRALPDTYDGNIIDRTVILSHQTQLQSPDIGAAFTAPELGLHAMGLDAANHVYFDDFGFQLYYLPDALFPTPLQQ